MILILLMFSTLSHSAECFVVSGRNRDKVGAFNNRKLLQQETSEINGQHCLVVDGWKQLTDAINSKKIQFGSSVMIIQGAHGTEKTNDQGEKEYSFACNIGDPKPNEILGTLNELAKKYKIGAAISSCYSGELMKDKLIQDDLNPENIDKLCLFTSSNPGRVATVQDDDFLNQLATAKSGETMEDIFKRSRAGMISSAAWNEIGLPEYLRNKTIEAGYSALQNLDKIVRGDGGCNSLGQINSALCVAPSVSDDVFKDLMNLMDPYVPMEDKGLFVGMMKIKASLLQKDVDTNPKNKSARAGQVCIEGVLNTYIKKYGEKLLNLNYWPDVLQTSEEIKSASFYQDCLIYKNSIKDPLERETILEGSFYTGTANYKEMLSELKKRYSKTSFDQSFDLQAFAKAATGEKMSCKPYSKFQIIQSMFGESFFSDEYVTNFEGTMNTPNEQISGMWISTQHAMKAFQNASLEKPKFGHVFDQMRRKACRDITF